MHIMKKTGATLALTSSLLLAGGALAGPASAAEQDGLVNIRIGNVTVLEDVKVALAAKIAAQACGINVGPVVVLAREVDRSGDSDTICRADQGPVRIRQN